MDTLTIYKINNKKYYLSNDVLKLNLLKFKGCTNGRRIIDEKKLTKKNYIYAKQINQKWVISDGKSYKWDKVFLSVVWVRNFIGSNDNEDICKGWQ